MLGTVGGVPRIRLLPGKVFGPENIRGQADIRCRSSLTRARAIRSASTPRNTRASTMNGPFSLVRRYGSIGSLGKSRVGGLRSLAGVRSASLDPDLMTPLSRGAAAAAAAIAVLDRLPPNRD